MRQTTNRERRLAILFTLAVFLLVNLMLLVFLKRQRAQLETTLATLQSQQTQADLLLNDRAFWDARSAWMEENKPRYTLSGEAQTDLIEMLQSTPREHGLDVTPPVPDEPRSMGTFEEVSATVKVTGNIRSVIAWLAQVQQPGKFYSISNFSLQSDKEPPKVICEVRVAKWFFLGAPTSAAPGEAPQAANSRNRLPQPGSTSLPPPAIAVP